MATDLEKQKNISYGARVPPQGTAAGVPAENAAINIADSSKTMSGTIRGNFERPSVNLGVGRGVIATNGKTIPVGGETPTTQPAATTQPISAPPIMPLQMQSAPRDTAFGARAKELVTEEQRLMDDPNGSIGAGIVARGMANRAKQFADIDAQARGAAVAEQNADTYYGANESQAKERLRASDRADKTTEVDVAGKKLEQDQIVRVNDLQQQYLKETDPAKREQIATQLQALTGKAGNEKFQPVMGKDDLGAFDNRRGDFKPQTQLATTGVPEGYTQIGTSGGRPVYQDAQGNKFIQ
jgi:hypothetical protein